MPNRGVPRAAASCSWQHDSIEKGGLTRPASATSAQLSATEAARATDTVARTRTRHGSPVCGLPSASPLTRRHTRGRVVLTDYVFFDLETGFYCRTDQSHSRDGGSQQNRPRSHAHHKASRGHLAALAGPLVGGVSPRLLEEALAGLEHARDVGQVGVDGREGRHDLAVVRLDDARERGHGAGHLG